MPNNYYENSPSGRYVLTLDGKEVLEGTEIEIVDHIHNNHCYSVSHALKYEGYKIEPVL